MELKDRTVDQGERGEYETRPASPRLIPTRNEAVPSNLAKAASDARLVGSHNAPKPFSLVYENQRKGGIEARFWAKVEKTETCWLWKASKDRNGYGRFRVSDRTLVAHVVGYALAGCELPAGMVLDHLCRNRACVRADHLEPVTHHENVLRSPRTYQTPEERREARNRQNREWQRKRREERMNRALAGAAMTTFPVARLSQADTGLEPASSRGDSEVPMG